MQRTRFSRKYQLSAISKARIRILRFWNGCDWCFYLICMEVCLSVPVLYAVLVPATEKATEPFWPKAKFSRLTQTLNSAKRYLQQEMRGGPNGDNYAAASDINHQIKESGLDSCIFEQLSEPETRWMKNRVLRMQQEWRDARDQLFAREFNVSRRRILVLPGVLIVGKLAKHTSTGGPLGELLQWSDLIASLCAIGHDVTVLASRKRLPESIDKEVGLAATLRDFDLIYTDIMGLNVIERLCRRPDHERLKCRFRVLDSFGTEPKFNHGSRRHVKRREWAGHQLRPKQFHTMFPHSPDNTFLGFAVSQRRTRRESRNDARNVSLVYGKRSAFWTGQIVADYIDAIHRVAEIHATVAVNRTSQLPDYVINHGIMDAVEYRALLGRSRIFVGLGFPYEGPAPLEALSSGAVFLNPKIAAGSAAESAARKFFRDKPTQRRLASQHDYLARHVGPPHVVTVDMTDTERVAATVARILNSERPRPFTPREFTPAGMLERVLTFVEKQDFCDAARRSWPPLSALRSILAPPSLSCADACDNRGLICEPDFFSAINTRAAFRSSGAPCARVAKRSHLACPLYVEEEGADAVCIFQGDSLLFSCVGSASAGRRLCPCRDFRADQIALCEDCLPW